MELSPVFSQYKKEHDSLMKWLNEAEERLSGLQGVEDEQKLKVNEASVSESKQLMVCMNFGDSYTRVQSSLVTPLWKELFQNDSIHFLLGNDQYMQVWEFYIVTIGPKDLIL